MAKRSDRVTIGGAFTLGRAYVRMGQILDSIHAPQDLKKLSGAELETLCEEIRQRIIHIVGQNGGHLASNLGAVELTVALHRVLDLPKDKLVWDVGHQAYTHKLLTGRNAKMDTIRQENGISGFPKREESEYDAFNVGHASTAISAAVGMAAAMQIAGRKERVVAVVGDGALTGGLALEGLNNAFYLHRNLVVVLNDNKMSISRSVGSLARYLSVLRTKPHYRRAKGRLVRFLDSMPVVGGSVHRLLTRGKNTVKRFVYRRNIFEDMGFLYYGPFDGHDLESLIQAFQVACSLECPVLVHVCTEKGKGYAYAEEDPGSFHGVPAFDIESGLPDHAGQNFSKVFGKTMCQLAGEDRRICAITAAMQSGTGLTDFRRAFSSRFFDVGIAEEHAVTFAAGLATQGMLPVFAVYSTFLQRSYDELLHDVGLQNLHVVLAVDRAGFVGDDGETHQGVFDTAFLSTVPHCTILAPSSYAELQGMMKEALYRRTGLVAVRYPRGEEGKNAARFPYTAKSFSLYGEREGTLLLVSYGKECAYVQQVCAILQQEGYAVSLLKLNCIHPLPDEAVELARHFSHVYFWEDAVRCGGIGEQFFDALRQKGGPNGKTKLFAVDELQHGQAPQGRTYEIYGMDPATIEKVCRSVWEECPKKEPRA